MIRVADQVAPSKQIEVFSNRGLAGIDGSISTSIGIALNTIGTTRAIIGDLTAIHDLGGMNLTELNLSNLQLWVVNDAGGKIFEQLELKDEVTPEVFDKYFQTPQQVSFEKIATAMGWGYELANSEQDIDQCLDIEGPVLIELRV
jgi:2-succinyl-5-enolpyruvyl-6-hydroxy-3-cyclohexene-1-carboxylate synthase